MLRHASPQVQAAAACLQASAPVSLPDARSAATGLVVAEDAMKPPSKLDADQLAPVLDTNVAGLVRVINAFLLLLETAEAGTIVNLSSDRGSMTILRCAPVLLSGVPCSSACLGMLRAGPECCAAKRQSRAGWACTCPMAVPKLRSRP